MFDFPALGFIQLLIRKALRRRASFQMGELKPRIPRMREYDFYVTNRAS